MRNFSKDKTLEESIIDLYLGLKIRKTEDEVQKQEEREKLRKTNPKLVLEYVKSSIDILISTTVKEKLERISQNNSDLIHLDELEVNEYEKLLRQVEGEVRTHIKNQYEMKIFQEAQQSKIEELEKANEDLKKKLKEANEKLAKGKLLSHLETNPSSEKKELEMIRSENSSLKNLLKSYEERNLNIAELEKKIRLQHSKHKSEIKLMEDKYLEKIKKYKKKLKQYEEFFKKVAIKESRNDYPDTERSNSRKYNRCGSMTERQKKPEDLSGKIVEYKNIIDKKLNEINNMNFTLEDMNHTEYYAEKSKERNKKTNVSHNNLTTNMKSENFETLNMETNPKTQRKAEKSKDQSSKPIKTHVRTNSIAGTKPTHSGTSNSQPNFHINLTNIQKKAKENVSSNHNYTKSNTQLPHQKSKEQLANIINIYTSNMNNIKTKEINLKQFVNNNKLLNAINKENNVNATARTFSNNVNINNQN